MSHWMTSGRSRLQAKQNRSFAHRAQQVANVVAPEAMMIQSYAIGPSEQDHPRKRRRSEGSTLKHSYANPITRRGKVVPIGRSVHHPPIPQSGGAMEREPLRDLNNHGNRRRIRDPSMKLHSTRKTLYPRHSQPPQFAGRMHPPQYVEAPPPQPPFASRTRTNEESWHDQYSHQPAPLPVGTRISSTRYDPPSLVGHPQEMYDEGGGGSYELHHQHEQRPRSRPEQGVSRFQKPSQQADVSSNYDGYYAESQCDFSDRLSSMQHPHPRDAYFLDSDLSGIPEQGAPLEFVDIEPPARQLFRSQSETHSRHSRHSSQEHHSGISVSSRTSNVGQSFGIPDRRRPKMDEPFNQAAHATRFRNPMAPPDHTHGSDCQEHDERYAQAPDLSRRPNDFQDNFPTNYVTAKTPTITGGVPSFSNHPRKEFGAIDSTRSLFEHPNQPMRQIADYYHPRAEDQNRQHGISRFQKTSASKENPAVAEKYYNFDSFGAHQDEMYVNQDQQANGVESRQREDSTSSRIDVPTTCGPRFFNDGVEVDITGRPLSRPNSPAGFSQFQEGSSHVQRQMAAGRSKEEMDSSLNFFEGVDLDDGKSIWDCFETQGTGRKNK